MGATELWPERPDEETTDAVENIFLPSLQARIYV
jgi:hypothetical protein